MHAFRQSVPLLLGRVFQLLPLLLSGLSQLLPGFLGRVLQLLPLLAGGVLQLPGLGFQGLLGLLQPLQKPAVIQPGLREGAQGPADQDGFVLQQGPHMGGDGLGRVPFGSLRPRADPDEGPDGKHITEST